MSGRALTQISITGALPLKNDMRVLGSLFFVPPISSVAQNEIGNVGIALTLIYGFRGPGCGCAHGMCPPRR